MVSMSKLDMVKYIRDYVCTRVEFFNDKDKTIIEAFLENVPDGTSSYYETMLRVYNSYVRFKLFSYYEDFYLNQDDYIYCRDIEDFEHKCTFYTDNKGINNKTIIRNIRNAFNHNANEEFKISKNGRYFEVDIKDTRNQIEIQKGKPEKPLHMKFDWKYLEKLYELMHENARNILFLDYDVENFDIDSPDLEGELDKVNAKYYHFNRKLTDDEMKIFNDVKEATEENIEELFKKAKELGLRIGRPLSVELTPEQKRTIINEINYYKEMIAFTKMSVFSYDLLSHIFGGVLVFPMLKKEKIDNEMLLSDLILNDNDLTFNKLERYLFDGMYDRDNLDDSILLNKIPHARVVSAAKDLHNPQFLQVFPIMMYFDSIITHLCTDDEIVIDGVTYKRNKLRNSLVHGRWYTTSWGDAELFNAFPENKNLTRLEYIGKISVQSILDWCNDYVYEKEKAEMEKEKNQYVPKLLLNPEKKY